MIMFRALAVAAMVTAAAGCQPAGEDIAELARFPLDDLGGVVDAALLEVESDDSVDGGGSLRLVVERPTTFRLVEVSAPDVDAARLVYQAYLRSEGLDGHAYLEMWCRFPGQGEYFSRALDDPVTGDVGWRVQATPFRLEEGQTPDLVRLNVVVDGSGTVWVDDLRLLRAPL